jgi:hypothetical protein
MQRTHHKSTSKVAQTSQEVCTLVWWNIGQLEKINPVDLELKDRNEKPYHAKLYPVPHSQEKQLKDEVQRLVDFGVLRKVSRSEWACPMFKISKLDKLLRSLADLRDLNKRIKN